MGSPALAARAPLLAGRRFRALASDATMLAFHACGGPLVALCGLTGGAGTSTLAYLLARRAACESSAPVLLAGLDDLGGLATITGCASTLGLRGLARAVDEERNPPQPFAEVDDGLRLVASSGREPASVSQAALVRLLTDAREAHGLVVVDAGHTGGADRRALLATASHILFVFPASVFALRRVQLLATNGALERHPGALTAVVAIAPGRARRARLSQLRRFAEPHVDRLLLVPHVPELANGEHERADPLLADTFAALATLLRRQP